MRHYTVKQVAALSGVPIRTLHYYDEIGLLRPAYVGENGYRYYTEDELLRLQQILLHRELGFALKEIAALLDARDFDRLSALKAQRSRLEAEAKRYRRLVATIDRTITRLEATSRVAPGAVPRFRHVTDRFEDIEIIGQIGSLHGANSMFFADVDGDGDLDFFWGDFFEPGVLFIRNTGSCAGPDLRAEPVPLRTADGELLSTSGYNVTYLADIDADGDLDLFVGVLGGAFNPNLTA
ncbi:MAG: MerR family transcriptional regulator, partial [Gammaproteobacteria bacterium]